MRVEHVRPFAQASVEVCSSLLGLAPQRGELAVRPTLATAQQVNAVCAIGGAFSGHVMLSMSTRTANAIAAQMTGAPVVTFDALAASAIAEFANMIGGRSLALLEEQGFLCTLSPPSVILGTQTPIHAASGPAIEVPLLLANLGAVEVHVSLDSGGSKAA